MPSRTPDHILNLYEPMLGKVPDHQIARQAGVSLALVLAWRGRLGIKPYQGYKFGSPGRAKLAPANGGGFRGRRSALDPFIHLLGQVPDAEIGRMARVTTENVRAYRSRRGIKANWKKGRAPATSRTKRRPAPAVELPPEPDPGPGPQLVFAITVRVGNEIRVYGMLARDTADAIRRAAPAIDTVCSDGQIKGIECVGDLLEDPPA